MSRKITIKEVAVRAGLSTTAVSQILNGKGARFSKENIQKVIQAKQALHYVPNSAARNLSNKTDSTIGVLVPTISNPFFSEFLQLLENNSDRHTHILMIGLDGDRSQLYSALEGLIGQNVDGLIIAVSIQEDLQVSHLLKANRVPYIVLDQNSSKDSDFIASDDFHGGEIVAHYLYSLGHRKFSVVVPDQHAMTANLSLRLQGFTETCRDLGVPKKNMQIVETAFTKHGGQRAVPNILAFNPSAIFTLSDELAIGVLGGLFNAGEQVPRDYSLVGYDDTDYAEFTNPKLTTVRQPIDLIAKYVLEMLKNRIADPAMDWQVMAVDVELIVRDSAREV